ncbi:MAG: glycosyltransferase family 2 protein [Chloroflexi bacterium]|nr:glycosyltransferase family 2 protein [Chloroflexota bacterium]
MVEANLTASEATADESPQASVTVIVPAYNESATIAEDVRRIRAAFSDSPKLQLLVINDGSTDGTDDLAKGAGASVISHPVNLGQGAAIKTGITNATGDFIVIVDGDGTYPAEDLPKLVSFTMESGYEQVIGDRQSEQGSLRLLRMVVKRLLRMFASFLSGQAVGDMNSGMRVLTKEAANRYLTLIPDGFSNSTTLTLASLSHRGRIAFIPIDYGARKVGKSKFRPIEDTYNMMLTVVRMVMYVDPLRVLLPIAFVFFIGGVGKGISDVIRFDLHITTSSVLLTMTAIQIAAIALIADLIVRRTR